MVFQVPDLNPNPNLILTLTSKYVDPLVYIADPLETEQPNS